MNSKPYQAFFKKRLQTQSFLDTEMSTTSMSDLTSKIISSLKDANRQSSKNRQRVSMAKSRLKTKENQQQLQRSRLKQKIQDRMRISQTNLQKINSAKKKALSSRSEFEDSQKKKIRQNRKRELQSSLVQMQKKQTETQNFFRDTQLKKKEQFKRLQNIPRGERTRYGSYYDNTNYRINDMLEEQEKLNNSRSNSTLNRSNATKISKPVLKVSQTQIYNKQKKKTKLQSQKQCRYLNQYVAKMENILNVRKKGTKAAKQATATLPKVISNQHKSKSYKKNSKSPAGSNNTQTTKYSVNRVSFTELYMQKLNEKKLKKQMFHSIQLQHGDNIMQKQHQQTKVLRQSKLIKQSLNQYRRWSNIVASYKNQK